MTTIGVSTHDLRRACRAVVKHTNPKSEHLDRVRFCIDPHNVTVTATDGWTSGLAIASVWESQNDIVPIPAGGEIVDLEPEQIRKILEVFKAPADKNEEPEAMLQIQVGDNYILITDVSGLPGINGESLKLPRMETSESFPDVAHTISRIRSLPHTSVPTFAISPHVVVAFCAAANAYKEHIEITAHAESRTLSVVVGESFLGLITPTLLTGEDKAKREQWSDSWEIRLPAPDSTPRNATRSDADTELAAAAAELVKSGVRVSVLRGGKDSDQ